MYTIILMIFIPIRINELSLGKVSPKAHREFSQSPMFLWTVYLCEQLYSIFLFSSNNNC